jgi:hypothetical protein
MLVSFAGDLVVPLINKRAIQAEYKTANARQLQSVYNYQRVILNAYTEVVNRVSKVQNYSNSIEVKKQQVQALDKSVDVANKLFQAVRIEYIDVLLAQRDLWEARLELIDTKQQQLSAIVNVYQALGGGLLGCGCADPRLPQPGPSLAQSHQGGSAQSGTDQLPSPRKVPGPDKLPDQVPDPRKLPEPDKLPKPSKLSERPPEPGKLIELPSSVFVPGPRLE